MKCSPNIQPNVQTCYFRVITFRLRLLAVIVPCTASEYCVLFIIVFISDHSHPYPHYVVVIIAMPNVAPL